MGRKKISAGAATTVAGLAGELGVAVATVEQLLGSACVAGDDFVDDGGVALFTRAGAEKIRGLVEEQMREETAEAETTLADLPQAAQLPRREDLRVTRVFRWSRNILAVLPNEIEVVLTVRTIAHLEAGMVLQGCIQGPMGWTYEGRLPRMLGERQLYFPPQPAGSKGKP